MCMSQLGTLKFLVDVVSKSLLEVITGATKLKGPAQIFVVAEMNNPIASEVGMRTP